MRKLTTALLAAAAISGAAFAEGNTASSGFYLGANAGVANTNVKYSFANQNVSNAGIPSYTVAQLTQNFKADSGKMAGIFGAFAGYGMVVGQGAYFGGEVYGGLDSSKLSPYDDSNTGAATGYFKTTVKRTNFYGLAARVGYMVTPSTLAYIRLGVEGGKWQAQVVPDSATITQAPTSLASSPTLQAGSNKTFTKSKNSISFAPGLGLEAYITKNMFLRAEYSYLFGPTINGLNQDIQGYPNQAFAGTNVIHNFKITQHQFKIGVGYKF